MSDTTTTAAISVRFENQRDFIVRLLAMPNEYPACERDNYIRKVKGSGASLYQNPSGAWEVIVGV